MYEVSAIHKTLKAQPVYNKKGFVVSGTFRVTDKEIKKGRKYEVIIREIKEV